MGLDNGFVLKSKKNKNINIELCYFRNYYELNEYIMTKGIKTNYEYEVIVSKELLKDLFYQIKDIAEALIKCPNNIILKYDIEGYPEEYRDHFYGEQFSPCNSPSAFAGSKLIRLYNRIDSMLEILENELYNENDDEQDLYIVFYSSS